MDNETIAADKFMELQAHNDTEPRLATAATNATPEQNALDLLPRFDVLAIFTLILAIDYSGLLSFPLMTVQPHPFWIPVVLAAVQYGMVQGVVAAIVASALMWGLGWGEPAGSADYYDFLLHSLREPILWLVAAGVLGSLRRRQQDSAEVVEASAMESHAQATILADYCRSLRQEVETLEHQVAASGATNAARCMEILHDLATASPERLEGAFRNVLEQLLGAVGIEVIIFESAEGYRSLERDATDALTWQPGLGRNNKLPSNIVDNMRYERRMLSGARPADGPVLADLRAAIVAPIPAPAGNVIGAVVIAEIDPDCFTPAGEAALQLGCMLLGQQLSRDRPTVLEIEPRAYGNAPNVIALHHSTGAGEK